MEEKRQNSCYKLELQKEKIGKVFIALVLLRLQSCSNFAGYRSMCSLQLSWIAVSKLFGIRLLFRGRRFELLDMLCA